MYAILCRCCKSTHHRDLYFQILTDEGDSIQALERNLKLAASAGQKGDESRPAAICECGIIWPVGDNKIWENINADVSVQEGVLSRCRERHTETIQITIYYCNEASRPLSLLDFTRKTSSCRLPQKIQKTEPVISRLAVCNWLLKCYIIQLSF